MGGQIKFLRDDFLNSASTRLPRFLLLVVTKNNPVQHLPHTHSYLPTTMPAPATTSRAKRVGALLFCPACGTLLDLPRDDQDEINCHQCNRKEPASCESNGRRSGAKPGMQSEATRSGQGRRGALRGGTIVNPPLARPDLPPFHPPSRSVQLAHSSVREPPDQDVLVSQRVPVRAQEQARSGAEHEDGRGGVQGP